MSETPKFGVNAKPLDQTPADQDLKPQEATVEAKADKPVFGTQAPKQEGNRPSQPVFGTQAQHPQPEEAKSLFGWLKEVFTLQPASFWWKQYGYGLLGLIAFDSGILWEMSLTFGIINLIFYPFTVTILQELGRQKNPGIIGSFVYGYPVGVAGDSLIGKALYAVVRFLIFAVKFSFSVFIGGIGLIYMLSQAKKLNV